jgi:hypothetical protein
MHDSMVRCGGNVAALMHYEVGSHGRSNELIDQVK